MSFLHAFKFKSASYTLDSELPEIYSLGIDSRFFVEHDLIALYTKILTDCVQRTQGIQEKYEPSLWDNCLESETRKGLVSLLAEAMALKDELFLVYDEAVGVLRKATYTEKETIRRDYEASAKSSAGVFISFKNYRMTDLLRVYSGMEYAVLNSLNKTMNLSKAIQFKMAKLRDTTGAVDSSEVIKQAKAIAHGLACGKDVLLDGDDEIATSVPNLESTKQAIYFLDSKRSFVLNLPVSYINGEQTPGIGSTGEADSRAVERGLKIYWMSVLKPAMLSIFNNQTTFKSHDFRMIDSAIRAVQTLEVVSEDLISLENKRLIVSALFQVDNDTKGKPKVEEPEEPLALEAPEEDAEDEDEDERN